MKFMGNVQTAVMINGVGSHSYSHSFTSNCLVKESYQQWGMWEGNHNKKSMLWKGSLIRLCDESAINLVVRL